MSAAEMWADGTPKRKSGFDPAVWGGEKPMAEPSNRPLQLGDYVELREHPSHTKPIARGLIMFLDVDDNGEQVFTLLTESWAHEGKPTYGTSGPWRASLVDRRALIDSNSWLTNSFVAKVFSSIAAKHLDGQQWFPWEWRVIGAAINLAKQAPQSVGKGRVE